MSTKQEAIKNNARGPNRNMFAFEFFPRRDWPRQRNYPVAFEGKRKWTVGLGDITGEQSVRRLEPVPVRRGEECAGA